MPLNLFNDKKVKSLGISAVMRNPNTLRTLKEGLTAPLGSSKRNRAKAVLKSVTLANRNRFYDGQGGPAGIDPFAGISPAGTEPIPGVYDPLTGAPPSPTEDPLARLTPEVATATAGEIPAPPSATLFVPEAPKTAISDVDRITKPDPFLDPERFGIFDPTTGKMIPTRPLDPKDAFLKALQFANKAKAAEEKKIKPEIKELPTIKKPAVPKEVVEEPTGDPLWKNIMGPSEEEKDPTGKDIQDVLSTFGVTEDQMPDADYLSLTYNALPADQKEQFKTLFTSVKAGVGPEAFAYQIMSDKEELKKMLPGVPDESLPLGASLALQVQDLKNTLKKEYHLDSQLDNILNMQRQGYTIENNLNAYVRGRDEYLSRIDDLIDKGMESSFNLDMANPETNKMISNYMNYLYTLKGRQQQRYINYVSDSVKEYENKINMANDTYKASHDAFAEEFQLEAAITAEDYTRFKTMLGDMYNNLKSREGDELTMDGLRYDVMSKEAEAIKDTMDALGTNTEIGYLKNRISYERLIEFGQEEIEYGYNKKTDMYVGDLGSLMESAQNEGYASAGVLPFINEEITKNATKMIPNDQLNKYFDNYSNMILEYYDKYKQYPGSVTNAEDLKQTLLDNVKYQLRQQFTDKPTMVEDIKAAIQALVGPVGWFKKTRKVEDILSKETKDKWMKDQEVKGIDKTILEAIYDEITKVVDPRNFSNPLEIFTTVYETSEDGTRQRVNKGSLDNLNNEELLNKIIEGMNARFQTIDMGK